MFPFSFRKETVVRILCVLSAWLQDWSSWSMMLTDGWKSVGLHGVLPCMFEDLLWDKPLLHIIPPKKHLGNQLNASYGWNRFWPFKTCVCVSDASITVHSRDSTVKTAGGVLDGCRIPVLLWTLHILFPRLFNFLFRFIVGGAGPRGVGSNGTGTSSVRSGSNRLSGELNDRQTGIKPNLDWVWTKVKGETMITSSPKVASCCSCF